MKCTPEHRQPGRAQRERSYPERDPGRFWPVVTLFLAGLTWLLGTGGAVDTDPQSRNLSAHGREKLPIEAVDLTGEVVTDRVAQSLEFLHDGRRVTATDEGEVGSNWRVVLYFDQLLATPTDFHNASLQLAERAVELTRLGPVEVVLAGEEVHETLPPTRDPDALSQALGWLRLRESAEHLQSDLRRSFLSEMGLAEEEDGEEQASGAEVPGLESLGNSLQVVVAEERALLRRHREQLLLWLIEHPSPGPKALFLVGSGFDAEPIAFYRSVLSPARASSALDALEPLEIRPTVAEMARVLAVYGWTALSYLPTRRGDILLQETDEERIAREETEKVDVIFQDGRIVDRTTIGLDAKEILRRRRQQQAEERSARPVLLDPAKSYEELAIETGGELLRGHFQLSSLLQRLPRRRLLAVEVASESATDPSPLEVRLGQGVEGRDSLVVRARRWVARTTPETVSRVRAIKILEGELDEGDLAISAALRGLEESRGSRLIVQRDVRSASGKESTDLRLTVVTVSEADETEVLHQRRSGWQRPTGAQAGDEEILEMTLPSHPDGLLVVVVEELDSGLWGAAFASFVESARRGPSGGDADLLLLPAPKAVHLLAPAQGFAMGRTNFETVISKSDVERVDFFLDGERMAVRRSPPFSAELDLGSLPQPRRVEVVAFDGADRELGRDYLVVNEGFGVFGVRIIRPRPDLDGGPPRRLVGPIDVEVEVEPRRSEGIHRVEFYWKESLVATRYARPFRQRIMIPASDPTGFVRAVAYLEDGASSEDVVFLNSPGSSERLQVNLMELYVVVTDRRGRPVTGLGRDVFRVLEDGEPQEIATFSDAGEQPLTVGLVIDSSASMFVKLPEVQFAASEFLRSLATRRDRAFVVGFGNEPRMTRTTTSDLPAVIRSLDGLWPEGQTAIWKAIVYSLVQLQGVPGKKALVVYSDGADEDPDFSYRTCLQFARRVGVPIYVILSNNEIVRTEGKGLSIRAFLDRLETLTDSVGGRVFMARVGDDLQHVYRLIDEELRSQYVVGYYSRDLGGSEWREIEVDVTTTGYQARTIAGYFR